MPNDAFPVPVHRASIDAGPGELHVRLADERDVLIAERRLPKSGDCLELADAVAVTIVSWEATLRPEGAPAPRSPLALTERASTGDNPRGLLWDVGLGAEVSLAKANVVPGALAELYASLTGTPLGLHLGATGSARNQVRLGGQNASWRRWSASVGPAYQRPFGRWQLAGHIDFSAAWFSAEGTTFPVNRSGTGFSLGALGAVRIARPFGLWAPWISGGASFFGTPQRLTIIGSNEGHLLPRWGAEFGAGISVGRFAAR